jgi:antirestriction protein
VACLASYVNGILHGLWIDAGQDVEDVQTDIVAMLASSPVPQAEEWAIHDYEGFCGFEVGEYEDLKVVSRVAKGIAEHGEAFAAYVSWAGTDEEALEQFNDHYMGSYESIEAWTREVAKEHGWERKLDEVLEPLVRPYVSIDYQGFAEQMTSQGWQLVPGQQGVHIFAP